MDRLHALREQLTLHALTAGTHGNISELERAASFPCQIIASGGEKLRYVEQLGPAGAITFGNGMNDVGVPRLAAIGMAILPGEGVAIGAL